MNTREIAAELRLSHWSGIMRERSESGLSIREYCKRAGFHENSFYYWQRKLRETACERFAEVQTAACRNGVGTPSFMEIRLKEPNAEPAITQRSQITISLAEIRITTDSAYPTDKLAALVRGLIR